MVIIAQLFRRDLFVQRHAASARLEGNTVAFLRPLAVSATWSSSFLLPGASDEGTTLEASKCAVRNSFIPVLMGLLWGCVHIIAHGHSPMWLQRVSIRTSSSISSYTCHMCKCTRNRPYLTSMTGVYAICEFYILELNGDIINYTVCATDYLCTLLDHLRIYS